MPTTTTTTYQVEGMSCDHCVAAVTSELGRLDGVTNVKVDLALGSVAVTSYTDLDEAEVRAAVDEAGYAVIS